MGFMMGGLPKIGLNPATVNLVCAGNSLTVGNGGNGVNGDYPAQMSLFTGMHGIVALNAGASGARTADMIVNRPTAIDARWDNTKAFNILGLWEGTNSIADGASAATAVTDMTTLISNCQTAAMSAHGKKWVIYLMTCIPRQASTNQAATDSLNTRLDAYNDLIRANYKTMGAKKLVDVRLAGSPFNPPSYTWATFESWATAGGLFSAGEISSHSTTHLNDAGYLAIAHMVFDQAVSKMPVR